MKSLILTILIAASIYGFCYADDRILTAQLTVGPYEVTADETDEYNKSNITESQVGLPVQYVITVTKDDVPVAGVRLDTWFANASGIYSGVSAENTLDEDYLRDFKEKQWVTYFVPEAKEKIEILEILTLIYSVRKGLTDENGQLTFEGIFPGAYSGRTVHTHFRARMYDDNGEVTYNNTTQLFFPQDVIDEVLALDAYADSIASWDTLNSEDSYYTDENLVTLTGDTTTGFVATYTIELPLNETSQSSSDTTVPGTDSGSSSGSGSGTPPDMSGNSTNSTSTRPRCLKRRSRILKHY